MTTLLPERPLLLSPTLAATIGLEEALMLQALHEAASHREAVERESRPDLRWVTFEDEHMQELFPFWQPVDLRRIQASLKSLGMIFIEVDPRNRQRYYLAIERADQEEQVTEKKPVSEPAAASRGNATLMPLNWQPDDNWVRLCKQHSIPDQFIQGLIPEFVSYWRERAQARFSWGNAFYKHVLREWRKEQTRQGAFELASTMSAEWRPSPDAMEILVNAGISAEFIEDAVPEFVLYWRERGVVHGAWNTKFIEHIRRQWAKFSSSFGRESEPRPIAEDWKPSAECYEILQLAEIDEHYANTKLPEFVMYWRDSGQARASWNTIFLQFIKQDWARRLKQQETAESDYAQDQSPAGSSQHRAQDQRVKEKFQRIADRSWAD